MVALDKIAMANSQDRTRVGIEQAGEVILGKIGEWVGVAAIAAVTSEVTVPVIIVSTLSSVFFGGIFAGAWKGGIDYAYEHIEDNQPSYRQNSP
jgi:hypothetical protein